MSLELDNLVSEHITHFDCYRKREGRCNGERITVCMACGRSGHSNCYGNGQGTVQINCCQELPCYSNDIEAAFSVEKRIAERGLIREYVNALCDITEVEDETLYYDALDWFTYDGLWLLIHATPEQRVRAALRAVAGEGEDADS